MTTCAASDTCRRAAALTLLALAACTSQPDRFYTLDAPVPRTPAFAAPLRHVRLRVTVPSLVDRAQMVLDIAPNGVAVLEHDRWAAPLSDQVTQIVARDLEAKRDDLFVGDRAFDQSGSPPVTVTLDVNRMSARPGVQVGIDCHWRIVDAADGTDRLGAGTFEAPLGGSDMAQVAHGYSVALDAVASRLAEEIHAR